MFGQKWRLISAFGSVALLPLAASHAPFEIPGYNPALILSAQVVTAPRPLDLASTSLSDFGDLDTSR